MIDSIEKYNIILWGKGARSREVLEALDFRKCTQIGWLDKKYQAGLLGNDRFFSFEDLATLDYDYIIVTLKNTRSIKEDIKAHNVLLDKIIFFWETDIDKYPFFDSYLAELRYKVRTLEYELLNYSYENGFKPIPHIQTIEETLNDLISNHSSICRFGDGEMRWIVDSDELHSKLPIWFQEQDLDLKNRLKEVIQSSEENIVIAISDIFGSLEDFVSSDKAFYREFLNTDNFRDKIMGVISMHRIYGNAFVSRPYWHYPDKSKKRCDNIFGLWKSLWKDRDVLLVEGEYVRFGVGNDLLEGADSVRRILCPHKNAYQYYNEILDTIGECVKNSDIILVALGPTATVMSFDLAKVGYQAIDIGQLDVEYEWYCRGLTERVAIEGKGVAEAEDGHIPSGEVPDDFREQVCREIHIINSYIKN